MASNGFENRDPLYGLPDDDLDNDIAAPKDLSKLAALPTPALYTEPCPACRGSGQFVSYSGRMLGQCFKCKGKGTRSFKNSKESRAKARDDAGARKQRREQEYLDSFKAANPAVWAWIDGNDFPFALAMLEAIKKFGGLTNNQLAACLRCVEKLNAAKAAAQARVDNAAVIDMTKIEAAFAKAGVSLKSPKLRVAGFTISPAKATSKNAGALYVVQDGAYLGKIAGAKFIRSRECQDAQEAELLKIAEDPQAAAVAYGRLTGQCACCGRLLENAESVARGIGPVCAAKFGWGG